MTEVLWDWLRDYVGIGNAGEQLSEEAFSNGYLIAELLARYNQQIGFPEAFRNGQHVDDKINNFSHLQNSLRGLGMTKSIKVKLNLLRSDTDSISRLNQAFNDTSNFQKSCGTIPTYFPSKSISQV